MFSVIFDMDGTLLDTQSISVPAWKYAAEQSGFKDVADHVSFVCGMNVEGVKKYITEHFPDLDWTVFRNDVVSYIDKNLVVKYKDGIKELLDFLKENNIKIGLASGTDKSKVMDFLNRVGATEYFTAIVGGDEIKNGKPNPEIFLKTAALMGVNPCDVIVFEDAKNGIIAGHNAGMKVIGVPDFAPFDDEAKSLLFKELDSADKAIKILKKLL